MHVSQRKGNSTFSRVRIKRQQMEIYRVNRIRILERWVCPLMRSSLLFFCSVNPKLWEKRGSVPSSENYSPVVRIPLLERKVFPRNRYRCSYDVVNTHWNNGIPSTIVRSNGSTPCFLVRFWLRERLTFEIKYPSSLFCKFTQSQRSESVS